MAQKGCHIIIKHSLFIITLQTVHFTFLRAATLKHQCISIAKSTLSTEKIGSNVIYIFQ